MDAGNLYIATSGWHYKDWAGTYYPKGLKPADWLSFYAVEFDSTEINNSFYRLPALETVISWGEKVPDNFKFSPKFSRYLTHIKKLNEPEEPFERFFSVFESIKEKLGVILLQLPPSLAFHEEKTERVFELIRNQYNEYDFAIEVRHPSWICDKSFSLMQDYNIAFTISQSGVGWPYAEKITARNVYLRLHGPRELFSSSYPDEMLRYFADKIIQWRKQGLNVWVYFNNDWFGYAIRNARTLKQMTEEGINAIEKG